jgi:hypothetical protein
MKFLDARIEKLHGEAMALVSLARLELGIASARATILQCKRLLADWRLSKLLTEFSRPPAERAYNPEQPRVSAGNPDGGQWTRGLAGSTEVDEGETTGENERTEVAADGHHFVPQALYRDQNLSPETRRVFDDAKTGPLRAGPHYFDHAHRAYSAAVGERYSEFLRERGLRDGSGLTPIQARQFAESIQYSSDPRIRGYNEYLYRREFLYWVRRLRLRE